MNHCKEQLSIRMRLIVTALVLLALTSGALARTCVCGAASAGSTVNVRSCASTSCSILGSVARGACHDYQATEGKFRRISFNGQTGYTHMDFMTPPQQCKDKSTGVTGCCMANLCSSYSSNQKRACDGYGCGHYGASRGSRPHNGWDIKCQGGATVYAPFDGTVVRRSNPYKTPSCCNTGFQINGSGCFAGYSAKIFYASPNRVSIPAKVTKGQAVATHTGLHCNGCYDSRMTDHIHIQLEYNGKIVDPTQFLFC